MLRNRLTCAIALAGSFAAVAIGCTVTPPGESGPMALTTVHNSRGEGGAADGGLAVDGGEEAAAAGSGLGSLLCPQTDAGPVPLCHPDAPTSAGMCQSLAPDGGPYDPSGGYADASLACRVVPSMSVATNGLGQGLLCAVSGTGMDGDSCRSGNDCAAGFDCVGAGVCRHYCCEGNAPCMRTDGGPGDQFCDIQPLAPASTTKIPVCMPIMPGPAGCTLLGSSCPMNTTCAVVREDGATSCVEVGNAQAGDSCETDHCASGLVCLGTVGARECFKLCSTNKPTYSCTAPATCQGGLPLFQDPSVGVCR